MSKPTGTYSITLPRGIAEAAEARGGPSGLSAYAAAAVARQIELDNLNDLITVAEAEHGPVTDEEIQSLRDRLMRVRREQSPPGASTA
ncbi:CopG family transcriptional regulator [Streptomyces sp. NPDC046203]|uniref:CopG family transcriptional regulator n=1 Tax=Streptomyces sp. NPDC046203 TaxID=3154602 RepID=UPI003411CE11